MEVGSRELMVGDDESEGLVVRLCVLLDATPLVVTELEITVEKTKVLVL